jgi:hypothetical protein
MLPGEAIRRAFFVTGFQLCATDAAQTPGLRSVQNFVIDGVSLPQKKARISTFTS